MPGATVDLLARCQSEKSLYYAAEVDLEEDFCATARLHEIEESLTRSLIATTTRDCPDGATIPWVARYALPEDDESLPFAWLSDDALDVTIRDECGSNGPVEYVATLGWGNGVFRGWRAFSQEVRHACVRGLIDAQRIWSDADEIISEAGDLMNEITRPEGHVDAQTLRKLSRNSATLTVERSQHELLFDELLRRIQGERRAVATTILAAWDYPRLDARLTERISDCAQLLAQVAQGLSSRRMKTTERILFVLSALTLIDFSLSMIATAFSGNVTTFPGSGWTSVFAALRSPLSDVLLTGTALMTVAMCAVYFWKSR